MKAARWAQAPCPCRAADATTAVAYADCCGRWHEGMAQGLHAPDPESLMRSRFSAYALAQRKDVPARALHDYLLATWHPSTVPGELELQPVLWQDLQVLHAEAADDAGVVEFIARFKAGGRAQRMHELSRFVREGGRWLYIDGVQPEHSTSHNAREG